ncbi:beta strand repeat-containing protein [Flavobacterium aurantiibacter]|uniref:AIR9-like A9 domain-containing protein n=1 Tax=Flavobacterium aurantiibacter TaxID=2023067 RepID=A0A255ZUE4_9FLAO|nr:T9SS sorting signal type C domain-containing protein [Flavobacterium aurantiibacter]OYQ45118.1 hypothetical protein CHX27_06725 [Flavobacterium aurantiibacter]
MKTRLQGIIPFLSLLALFLGMNSVSAQVILGRQDFETTPATPTLGFSNTGGGFSSGNNPAAGIPSNAPLFTDGARGFQSNNTTATLTFSNLDVTNYESKTISFRLAGMSINNSNGIDSGDLVTVAVSVDGGTTYSNEITVAGSTGNRTWSFAATGSVSQTYDGDNTPAAFTSNSGSGGISTVTLNIPNNINQVRLRITLLTDVANERYVIDDVRISGVLVTNNAPVASDVNFTGSLIVGQTLTGSYTYTDANDDLQGTSTFRWFRADNAAGLNEAPIANATGATYTLQPLDFNKFISFGVTPVAQSGTLTGSEVRSSRQGPIESLTNSASTITIDNTFTPLTNIDYAAHVGADVTATSPIIGQFVINDLPGTTADAFPTTLNAITFTGAGMGAVQRLAIYDSLGNEVAEIASATNPSFTGLTLSAPSGGTAVFSVRATFNTTVTDNTRIGLTVSNAVADAAGSIFATTNAGGAATSVAGNDNLIEVIATALTLTTNASTAVVNLAMLPAPVVQAVDVNGNRDLDFTGSISVTTTGVFAVASTNSVSANLGVATFSNIVHAAPGGTGLQLSFSGIGSPISSATFDVYNTLYANTISGSSPGNVNNYIANQFLDPNVTSTGISKGPGINGVTGDDRYNTNSYDASTTVVLSDYIQIQIAPIVGKQIDFTAILATFIRTPAGPRNFEVRSSVDNFQTVLWNVQMPAAASTIQYIIPIDDLVNISSAVQFRIYGFNSGTGNFAISNVSINGSVENTPNPSLNAAPGSIIDLNYALAAGPSASQTITVNAANLTPVDSFLTVTAPANFEVSTDNTTFASSVQLPYTGNSLTNAPVYVRLVSGLSANAYSGSVEISGGGTTSVFVTVSGTVYVPFTVPYFNAFNTQTLYNNAALQGFQYAATAFNAGGGGYAVLSINGTITAPAFDITGISQVEVSFDGATFGTPNGQTLTLEVSEDGTNYNTIGSITYLTSNFVNFRQTIDFSTFVGTTAYIRVRMSAGTNQSRFRNFYISTFTTWTGTSWTNGAPNSSVVALIDGDYNTAANGDINAKRLAVTSGDVLANGLGTISLVEDLAVNGGTVVFESGSNLIQQNNNYANAGNITVQRVANLKRQDYIYWGAPVTGQNLLDFSQFTLTNRFYTFNEPTNAFVNVDPAATAFVPGRGYMIRAANNHPSTNTNWTGTFEGVPNNGTYNVPVTRTTSGYNIIANPYPSPISCQSFVAANPNIGTLYFWAHITQGAGSAANYATWNGTGAAAPAGGATPNGTIQTGQGFLVQLPATPTITSVNFNNGMRIDDHANQFFRPGRQTLSQGSSQPNRLWIDLSSGETNYNQVLLGYVDGATAEFDTNFDGKMIGTNSAAIYTLLDNEKYTIQGKANPVDLADETALGFSTETAGNFTFTLANIDGIFANGQNIYIRDYATGTVHNLSEGPFTFASEIGTFNERFTIAFEPTTLSVNNPVESNNTVVAIRNNNGIQINAGSATLQQVTVFDITGRQITSAKASGNQTTVATNNLSNQVLLVKIVTDKGTVTKKLAY